MKRQTVVYASLLIVLCTVFIGREGNRARAGRVAAKPPVDPQANADRALRIVELRGRHHSVTIDATPDGPRYGARSRDGVELVGGATVEELRTKHPEIYRQVIPAIAEHSQDGGRRHPPLDESAQKSDASRTLADYAPSHILDASIARD